ncbi:O-antigen ligase family protein [Lysobacter arvi]|uniref:O-antigen ligase family protein n=1 Tax=Lysobacter arvi TaxID=3038776 RepID=A0ABU1CB79_9GAMM|nr:O-antigen ligase family protein [Lysobacter arvi]MDR0181659.1 O-antigen ligase family protein [Lysobacter arvi]
MLPVRTIPQGEDRALEFLAAALVVSAFAFGGGSRGLGDVIVLLTSLPVLFVACLRWSWAMQPLPVRVAVLTVAGAIAWHAVQLILLPASWIRFLPMRAEMLADLEVAQAAPSWLPMTLDRWGTIRSMVALTVFGAMLSMFSSLGRGGRIRLLKVAVLTGCAMSLLGYAQAAAGQRSGLRFYDYHHMIGALGTFANRNHFACLMAMLAPIAIGLAAQATKARKTGALMWHGAATTLLLAAGLSFSRTGFVLACASAVAAFLLTSSRLKRSLLGVAFAVLAAAGLITAYAWSGLSARLQQDPLKDLRWQYVRYGWQAVKAYFPYGSGPGSFQHAYAPFEPVAKMGHVYALHAHNEFLELALEWGLVGGVFIIAVLVLLFFVVRNKLIVAERRSAILVGSVVATTVPMLHSLVDYPLRTYAIMAALALASSMALSRGDSKGGRE